MGHLFGLGCFFLTLVFSNTEAQRKYSINVSTKCLGNVMRVDIGPLGGSLLEVVAFMNETAVVLTPSLASQCGFSMKTDGMGNAMIFASLQNCFAHNAGDAMFTTALHLRLHGNQFAEDEVYQVVETCHYEAWASREIICDYNYMEVSVKRSAPDAFPQPQNPFPQTYSNPRSSQAVQKLPMDADFIATTIVFYTPEGEKFMPVADAQKSGFGIGITPKRLVLRSPKMAAETYTQNVAGVSMSVLKTSTIFEKKWLATQIDAAAACPIQEGSVFFTSTMITWYLPRQMNPIISSSQFKLLEVHFGINGERLGSAEMAGQFFVTLNDFYIVTEIAIGAVGGYYKSHVYNNQYYISYIVEPMLELLWSEDVTYEHTRYKVFFPIETNILPKPLQLIDRTVPSEGMFNLVLGHFAADVALINITFPSGVLSHSDCNARGFNILEHWSNSSMKVFTLQVPFVDPVVMTRSGEGVTVYSLHMTFGLMLLEDLVTFSYTAYVEVVIKDIVPPSVSGGCDNYNFYILVKYGTQGYNFQTMIGKRYMTPSLAQEYNYMENGTHFSFAVPFTAPDVAIEAIKTSIIRGRLDVSLSNPETHAQIKDFSVACNFPSTLTECFPNGTMTALALKLESVPNLDPSKLALEDPSCGPVYSNDRYAFFIFSVNSCGTRRKFMSNAMLYENEISLPVDPLTKKDPDSENEYNLKVSCVYDINKSQVMSFNTRPRRSEPYAENSKGQLQVLMSLALDDSFSEFQRFEDYPISKYLQQPLYFEVALHKFKNPDVSLELENCWATPNKDKMSHPRWNLIVNGCPNPVDPYQVIFHRVLPDERVQFPSLFKRFEVRMFAFGEGQDDFSNKLFFHCEVVICNAKKPLGGVCSGQCPNTERRTKGQRRAVPEVYSFEHVSFGPIQLIH